MRARSLLPLLLVTSSTLAVRVAQAEPSGARTPQIEVSLGLRAEKISDSGYDPFASSDEQLQVSLGASGTLLELDRLSFAAVGFWDYGRRGSSARGDESSLALQRLSVGPELRYRLLEPLYLFLHAAPAFAYSKASIYDGVASVTRSARHWAYGADLAGGAALQIYEVHRVGRVRPQFWVITEAGYGYLSSTALRLRPETDESSPQRSVPLDLGSLSLAGPYLRLSAAVSL